MGVVRIVWKQGTPVPVPGSTTCLLGLCSGQGQSAYEEGAVSTRHALPRLGCSASLCSYPSGLLRRAGAHRKAFSGCVQHNGSVCGGVWGGSHRHLAELHLGLRLGNLR